MLVTVETSTPCRYARNRRPMASRRIPLVVLRQNSGTAPPTGIHLRNNVTQTRRILLILKSAELLANDWVIWSIQGANGLQEYRWLYLPKMH